MSSLFKNFFSEIFRLNRYSIAFNKISEKTDRELILTARTLIHSIDYSCERTGFKDIEFSVFSQWGDDGIIQYLIRKIDIPVKTFIEFGVENYKESNTRFLLINDNWSGLVIDSSEKNINSIKNDSVSWKYDLKAINAFIDAENINNLISSAGFSGEIGILSIDIDGNDYWIWKAIKTINPIIVIIEFNSVFGAERTITVPYKKDFFRTREHFSNLYFGASLPALYHLAEEKGYYFIGCDSHGVNAYFIRKDKINNLKPLMVKEGYISSKFAQSRDVNGLLNHLPFNKQQEAIKGLEVINILTNKKELL